MEDIPFLLRGDCSDITRVGHPFRFPGVMSMAFPGTSNYIDIVAAFITTAAGFLSQ
jgi:hypothetical protein